MKPKIVFVRGDYSACSYYRIFLPYKALDAKGYAVNIEPEYEDFETADILVFQRLHKAEPIREVLRWKERGKKVVVDFDDNFFHLESHNPAKLAYPQESLKNLKFIISEADAITVTVKPLADSFGRFNKNIFILPNAVDETAFNFPRRPSVKPIVGWQGSPTHRQDLRRIKSAINTTQRKYNFDFVLAGYKPQGFFRESTYRDWLPFKDDLSHQKVFNDFDIGICPLQETPFNDCKSDLKFLEYATLGIPTIASKTVTYETIENGRSGYLARNLADWERSIGELIQDEDKRNELGANAKEYVLNERTIQKNINLWEDVYNNLGR